MKKLFFLFVIFLISCQTKNQSVQRSQLLDTVKAQETFNEEDLPVNEYLTEQLTPIRENFKRINSVSEWEAVYRQELEESTEGGEALFYYHDRNLEKIITRNYGEMAQMLTEYYLMDGKLSFVFEKLYKYNRPIYHDSTAMIVMNDTEFFDFDKSEIIETRNYFDNGKLIHQLSNQDCGAPFATDYLQDEQKRIVTAFKRLVDLQKAK